MAVRRKQKKQKKQNNKNRYVWTLVVATEDDADNGVHIVCDSVEEFEKIKARLQRLDRFEAFEKLDKAFGLTR